MNTVEATNNTGTHFKPGIIWYYWAATTILLLGVLSGIEYSYQAVVALNVVQVIHFAIRERSISAFPVQVRITYLVLLVLSQAPYMVWILWWQLIGTAAMVFFKYCFLARVMSLMPWNKSENYSSELIKSTFLSAPVTGNILQGLPAKTA